MHYKPTLIDRIFFKKETKKWMAEIEEERKQIDKLFPPKIKLPPTNDEILLMVAEDTITEPILTRTIYMAMAQEILDLKKEMKQLKEKKDTK